MLTKELLLASTLSGNSVTYPPPSVEYPFWVEFDLGLIGSEESDVEALRFGTFNRCAQSGIVTNLTIYADYGVYYDDNKETITLTLHPCNSPFLVLDQYSYWAISPVYPTATHRCECAIIYSEADVEYHVELRNAAGIFDRYQYAELFRAIFQGAPWTIIEDN